MAQASSVIHAVTKIANNYYSDILDTTDLLEEANLALQQLAAGVMLETGEISPPLSNLIQIDTVETTSLTWVALPSNYQRHVFSISDSAGNLISGDYVSFSKFLKQVSSRTLTEAGSVYRCCVVGSKLYYQGIPASTETLTLIYHRKPATLTGLSSSIEGIPEHLQIRLLRNYIGKELAARSVSSLPETVEMHTRGLEMALHDLILYEKDVSVEPEYYDSNNDTVDAGICD